MKRKVKYLIDGQMGSDCRNVDFAGNREQMTVEGLGFCNIASLQAHESYQILK